MKNIFTILKYYALIIVSLLILGQFIISYYLISATIFGAILLVISTIISLIMLIRLLTVNGKILENSI